MFRRKKSVILFLLPGLLGIMVFYIVPFFGGIYFSLTDGSFYNRYVGFDNYLRVWKNEMFQEGLSTTMSLSLICAPLIWALSFALSYMLKSLKNRSGFFRNVLLLPYLMPSSALLIIWQLMFDYGGVINRMCTALGAQPFLLSLMGETYTEGSRMLWLEGGALRAPIILLYVWKNLGFSVVLFSAALQSVPEALYEYASLEGAGPFKQAVKITLPQILPTAFLVFVLAWVNAFKIFKEAYFIGGAYHDVYTLQHFMNNRFSQLEYQDVTTAAYSFAVIVFVFFGFMYLTKAVRSPNEA